MMHSSEILQTDPVWCRNLDPNKVRRTEAGVLPDVLLTTDSWNMLVRLCAKCVSNEPDSATKHPQQNPRQANLNIQSCTSSAGISPSAWSTPSGCQLQCQSPTWWQTGMETCSRSSLTNLDPPAGNRCWARCRCCLRDGWWSQHQDSATTHRWSSGPVSEWVSDPCGACVTHGLGLMSIGIITGKKLYFLKMRCIKSGLSTR